MNMQTVVGSNPQGDFFAWGFACCAVSRYSCSRQVGMIVYIRKLYVTRKGWGRQML